MDDGDPLDLYRRRLTEIERESARLATERDKLSDLIRFLESPIATRPSTSNGARPAGAGVQITPAIIDHVRANPGITGPQLADDLGDLVKTTRPDARHALIARTSELIKKGLLKRDKHGRITLADVAVP
jgi:hypothetical protein